MSTQWWRTAVIYQVYPRSYSDGNGDGTGDLPGITARLEHLVDLGVDALWLSPFYPSPQLDGGYDVADYCDVDPRFGTLADAEALVARAHELGLRVVVDLVPNHSSWEHPDFRAALAAEPGSPEREKYVFRDGRGPDGDLPPTDWVSMFRGPAWTRTQDPDGTPGQWYLHLFDASQPDWNWESPQVRAEFEDVLRFWLDRGVDGFRVDVCDALVKDPTWPSWPHLMIGVVERVEGQVPPMWDQEGIHEIFRSWRALLDTYPGERILCAEAWLPPDRAARIVRPDEMHQAFNFPYLEAPWRADELRPVITTSLAANGAVGAPTTWVLSNHDGLRHTTRFGFEADVPVPEGIRATDPQPDRELGLRRARAATLLTLGLPGSVYLYQGEELGLPEVTDLDDDLREDPGWFRSGKTVPGRDGCRVPLPWQADAPSFGFGSDGPTWLPQPAYFADYAVDRQAGVVGSTLEMYRRALALRAELGLGGEGLAWAAEDAGQVLAVDRGDVLVIANTSADPVSLPEGEVLLASGPGVDHQLPGDTTAWVRRRAQRTAP